ncbi:MAG: hypothetical protein WCP21_12005, partial [Armatimonadota bacterium]
KQTSIQVSTEERAVAEHPLLLLDVVTFDGVAGPLQFTIRPIVRGRAIARKVVITVGLLNAKGNGAGLANATSFFAGCWCLKHSIAEVRAQSADSFVIPAKVVNACYGMVQLRYRITWEYGQTPDSGTTYGEITYVNRSSWGCVRRFIAPVGDTGPLPDLSALVVAVPPAKDNRIQVLWIKRENGRVGRAHVPTACLARQGFMDNESSQGSGVVDPGKTAHRVAVHWAPGEREGTSTNIRETAEVTFDRQIGDWLHLSGGSVRDDPWLASRCVRYTPKYKEPEVQKPGEGYGVYGKVWWSNVEAFLTDGMPK